MNFLEKSRNKLVHFFFPFVERFYLVISLALILPVWFIPGTYWQIRIISFFLWFVIVEIHWVGTMERDYLPIQPGSGLFYHIYRFINAVSVSLLLIFLAILMIVEPLWLKNVFLGVFIITVILRAIGDQEYRPKKPEE